MASNFWSRANDLPRSRAIEPNIREAIRQLQRNLNISPCGVFGVAAIPLSCAFNPGTKVFSGNMQELGMLLDNMLDQHRPYLSSVHDSRICCVLFHVATPALADGVDLVRAIVLGCAGAAGFCRLEEFHGAWSGDARYSQKTLSISRRLSQDIRR
jgi:hypothetical protein